MKKELEDLKKYNATQREKVAFLRGMQVGTVIAGVLLIVLVLIFHL